MKGYMIHPRNAKGHPVFAKTLEEAIKIKSKKSSWWIIQEAEDVKEWYRTKGGKPVYIYKLGKIINEGE